MRLLKTGGAAALAIGLGLTGLVGQASAAPVQGAAPLAAPLAETVQFFGPGYGPGYGFYGPRPYYGRPFYGPPVVCRFRPTPFGPRRVCFRRY